jgi:hypothetical protein
MLHSFSLQEKLKGETLHLSNAFARYIGFIIKQLTIVTNAKPAPLRVATSSTGNPSLKATLPTMEKMANPPIILKSELVATTIMHVRYTSSLGLM